MELVGKSPDQICLEVLRKVYEEMLEAYRNCEDKEEGCKRALKVYRSYRDLLYDVQTLLEDIEDFRGICEESLVKLEEARIREEKIVYRIQHGGSVVAKLIPCGKKCRGCPHGPYLYRVVKVGGRQIWKYLGKAKK